MLDAGVTLALGSDAPVSPLDPWLAIAAAVHRSADDRDPWHPEQALTAREALAASTDGQGTLGVGSRGDIVLLDADPLAGGPADTAALAATCAACRSRRRSSAGAPPSVTSRCAAPGREPGIASAGDPGRQPSRAAAARTTGSTSPSGRRA